MRNVFEKKAKELRNEIENYRLSIAKLGKCEQLSELDFKKLKLFFEKIKENEEKLELIWELEEDHRHAKRLENLVDDRKKLLNIIIQTKVYNDKNTCLKKIISNTFTLTDNNKKLLSDTLDLDFLMPEDLEDMGDDLTPHLLYFIGEVLENRYGKKQIKHYVHTFMTLNTSAKSLLRLKFKDFFKDFLTSKEDFERLTNSIERHIEKYGLENSNLANKHYIEKLRLTISEMEVN